MCVFSCVNLNLLKALLRYSSTGTVRAAALDLARSTVTWYRYCSMLDLRRVSYARRAAAGSGY